MYNSYFGIRLSLFSLSLSLSSSSPSSTWKYVVECYAKPQNKYNQLECRALLINASSMWNLYKIYAHCMGIWIMFGSLESHFALSLELGNKKTHQNCKLKQKLNIKEWKFLLAFYQCVNSIFLIKIDVDSVFVAFRSYLNS